MTIKNEDFIEIDYTGRLTDGTIFDTTIEQIAKENNMPTENAKLSPAKVCVGERQLLSGLDDALVGKDVGQDFTVNLTPEQAFGKRDIKKMKIMPVSAFKEHNMQPQPGLQVDVDGQVGIITRVSGGRVIVNFNHPLAGKEVTYEVKILRKIDDDKEKLTSYLNNVLRIPEDKLKLEIKEDKVEVMLPFALPPQFTAALAEKAVKVTGYKEIKFVETKAQG